MSKRGATTDFEAREFNNWFGCFSPCFSGVGLTFVKPETKTNFMNFRLESSGNCCNIGTGCNIM